MENLILSAQVVLPLFLLMAAGYAARQLKLFDMQSHAVMNRLVFRLFLPMLLFKNIRGTSLESALDGRAFAFAVVGVLVMWGLLFLLIPRIERDDRRRGVLIQGIGRSNFVLYGLPLSASLCGGDMALTSWLVAVVVPMFNVLSVIALEVYRGGRVRVGKILLGIAKNPLIISSLLGIAFLLLDIRLPQPVEKAVSDLASIATPLALFLLGGSLEFSRVRGNLRPLVIGVAGRLAVMPLIFISAAILLGFRNVELASLMVLFMAPTAVNSYTMAQQMDADAELAGQQVVFTTALSILTIFLFILAARTLQVI